MTRGYMKVFENYTKSLILHQCERNEQYLFSCANMYQQLNLCQFWLEKLKIFEKILVIFKHCVILLTF